MVDHTSFTLVISFCCDISYISFIVLFMISIIMLSSICSLSCYYGIHTVCMHENLLLFLHTLWVISDDPGFAHPKIGWFISLIRCWWALTFCEESEVSICWLLVFLFLLHFYYFLSLYASDLVVISFQYTLLSCVDIYVCYCSDRDLL